MANGIPIPKNSEKALQVQGDNIALNITIRARSAALAATDGEEQGEA